MRRLQELLSGNLPLLPPILTTLIGGLGNDILIGTLADDTLYGSTGEDWAWYMGAARVTATLNDDGSGTARHRSAQDVLSGIEHLLGGDNRDTLTGNNRDNSLVGGLGNDTLSGGVGADVFGYQALAWGNDSVTDFADGTDRIDFTGLNLGFVDLVRSDAANGAVIAFTSNGVTSTITLTGVAVASLDQSDFLF
jgi:Ca2+-binding RTX toxin-like protein